MRKDIARDRYISPDRPFAEDTNYYFKSAMDKLKGDNSSDTLPTITFHELPRRMSDPDWTIIREKYNLSDMELTAIDNQIYIEISRKPMHHTSIITL